MYSCFARPSGLLEMSCTRVRVNSRHSILGSLNLAPKVRTFMTKQMNHLAVICSLVAFLGLLATFPAAAQGQAPGSNTTQSFKQDLSPAGTVMIGPSANSIRAGHILVRFKTTPAQEVLSELSTAFGAKVVGTI